MAEKADPVLAVSQAFLKRFGEDSGKKLLELLPEIASSLLPFGKVMKARYSG